MIDFSTKKAILIEDMAEARILQKKMLTDFGFKSIDIAMKAESAIELLRNNSYDLILSDYNLGNGKDGQQLLEEVRCSALIPNTSTYLMVTAETSIEMVMGAIEYQPDGYITKPFSQALLQRRLLKLLENKEKLKNINIALDTKNYDVAIQECRITIEKYPFLQGKCNRIIGECYIALEEYDKAKKLYSKELKKQKMPWSLFGLAKTHLLLKEYAAAETKLKQLMLDNKFFVNAYDWLAKCLIAQGRHTEAQAVLIDALERSPKSILRQIELGRLSLDLKDYHLAEISFRRAVFLAKHSCFNSSDIYLNHLRAIVGIASQQELLPRQKESFKSTLKKVEVFLSESIETNTAAHEIKVQLYLNQNDKINATDAFSLWEDDFKSGAASQPYNEIKEQLSL
ncbi:response regulator [Marinomonas sp. 15G1-11]|uniref:Response regulator n=1 Tax=Marinomonas phaeophyticola TaxID=3004091 RepID=A0ABT4JQ13_9GAMM|nr:response regulator [Marinomonas sp. 15G1-11]MCZ2720475.1 response regulator [Marinomonas sp. 15G1-11]